MITNSSFYPLFDFCFLLLSVVNVHIYSIYINIYIYTYTYIYIYIYIYIYTVYVGWQAPWHYNPWRALTSFTTSFHSILFLIFFLHPRIPILCSFSSSSPNLLCCGLQLLLLPWGFPKYSLISAQIVILHEPYRSIVLLISDKLVLKITYLELCI